MVWRVPITGGTPPRLGIHEDHGWSVAGRWPHRLHTFDRDGRVVTDGNGHSKDAKHLAAIGRRRYRAKTERRRRDRARPAPVQERAETGANPTARGRIGRCESRPGLDAATRGGRMAWQREPLDVAGRGGRIVVLRAAAQSGKSSVGLALAGARLQLGQPVLIVEPTARPAAVEFARERLEPLLSSQPFAGHLARLSGMAVWGNLPRCSTGRRPRADRVSLAGAESPSQLSARGAACLVLDEVARYPRSRAGREGDPILLALERTEAWRKTRAVFLVSTPVEPGDPFDEWYQSGDQRHWFVPVRALWRVLDARMGACEPRPPRGARLSVVRCRARGRTRSRQAARRGRVAPDRRGETIRKSSATTYRAGARRPRRWRRSSRTISAPPVERDRWRPGRGPARRSRANRTHDLPDVGPIQARLEDPSRPGPPRDRLHGRGDRYQSDRLETLILGMPADRSWAAVLDYHVTRRARPRRRRGRRYRAFGTMPACGLGRSMPATFRAWCARWRVETSGAFRSWAGRVCGNRSRRRAARDGASWSAWMVSSAIYLLKVDSGWLRLPAAPWCYAELAPQLDSRTRGSRGAQRAPGDGLETALSAE